MSQKAFYRMNPATGQYERVYPGAWQRIASSLRHGAVGAAVAVGAVTALYIAFDFPKERVLRAENERLQLSVEHHQPFSHNRRRLSGRHSAERRIRC